jgi:hypothetical protein
MAALAPLGIQCPACREVILIRISARIVDSEFAHLGMAELVLEPDTADLWGHMWTHTVPAD